MSGVFYLWIQSSRIAGYRKNIMIWTRNMQWLPLAGTFYFGEDNVRALGWLFLLVLKWKNNADVFIDSEKIMQSKEAPLLNKRILHTYKETFLICSAFARSTVMKTTEGNLPWCFRLRQWLIHYKPLLSTQLYEPTF